MDIISGKAIVLYYFKPTRCLRRSQEIGVFLASVYSSNAPKFFVMFRKGNILTAPIPFVASAVLVGGNSQKKQADQSYLFDRLHGKQQVEKRPSRIRSEKLRSSCAYSISV